MPFYVADYLADTTHLNTQQHGAYCLLLFAGWRNGGRLPNDDEQLAMITRLPVATWLKHKPVILKFFKIDGDEIYQGRMVEEWDTATGIIERNRINGGKGGRPPKQKPKNNPVVSENVTQMEPKANPEKTPLPSPSPLPASNEASSLPGRHERLGEVGQHIETILNSPVPLVLAEVDQWLKGGADPDLDIYPTVERLKPKWSGPSLKYFTQAIADSVATRKTPLPPGKPRGSYQAPSAPVLTADERAKAAATGRQSRLELARKGIPTQSNTPHDFDAWIASGELTEDQARMAGWSGPRRVA